MNDRSNGICLCHDLPDGSEQNNAAVRCRGILRELTPEEMEDAFRQHLIERNKEKTA